MTANKKRKGQKEQMHQATEQQQVAAVNGKVSKYTIVVILFLTAAVYIRALQNGIVHIDDDMYLLKNPFLRDFTFSGLKEIFTSFYEYNYHPLTTLTFWLEYRLFEFNPVPYHLFNVVLHLINTWLVYRLATRLSGKTLAGAIVAVLFAIHPMHVESVAWISERKGLLCALFYFLSLLYYLRYVDLGLRRKHLVLSGLFFLTALFSKSAAVTLPVLLLLIDWYRGRKLTAGVIGEKLPFFLLSILFGILAIMSQKAGGALNDVTLEYGLLNRILIFTGGLAFYFEKLIVPYPLSAIHYFPNSNEDILPWLFYASVPILVFVFWLINRKSPWQKEARFGGLFFLISISVMLQLLTVGAAYASERYTYVSYFGLFYIIAQVFSMVQGRSRTVFIWVGGIFVVVFYVLTNNRISAWENTETIFSDIVAKNPGNNHNYLVYTHWGDYYVYNGRNSEAMEQYDKSLDINPYYAKTFIRRGEAQKQPVYAILDYNEAIKLNPGSAIAYNNRGWAYFQIGDKVLAESSLDSAINLDSNMATAYNNRGWVRWQGGDTAGALDDFSSSIRKARFFTKPLYNRAMVNVYTGRYESAIMDYNKLIEMDHADGLAYFNRGLAHISNNDTLRAVEDFRKASDLGNKDAYQSLRYLNK